MMIRSISSDYFIQFYSLSLGDPYGYVDVNLGLVRYLDSVKSDSKSYFSILDVVTDMSLLKLLYPDLMFALCDSSHSVVAILS